MPQPTDPAARPAGAQTTLADERRGFMRAAVQAPANPGLWGRIAINRYRDPDSDTALGVAAARRATVLAPDQAWPHRFHAALRFSILELDEAAPAGLVNSLRRFVILETDLSEHRALLDHILRRIGDLRGMLTLPDWAALHRAAAGQPVKRKDRRDLEAFAAEFAALAPYMIDADFAPRIFADRVLLHPKLPDDGAWVLNGPADQVARVLPVLRLLNPGADIAAPGSGSDAARTLSLVPCDDPDAWYLPCLWGHPHVWWTVLPAVLDDAGRPSLERARSFAVRTGQFVTFWSGKGTERAHIARNAERGRRIAERMGDDASRESYLQTMAAERPLFLRRFFTETAHRLQYFDYAVYRPGDVILSLGVAEGFEVPAYLALIAPGGALHNIDPDGHDRLGAPARAWVDGTDCAVHVHRIAMSDVDGEIHMDPDGHMEDARLTNRAGTRVKALPSKRLDTFVAEQGLTKIDHIKLDIEGGEGFLLDQLIAVMNSHRPQIEISIYHTIEQFFDIPERMMAETERYRFFFHHYSGQFAEATLYAIPQEIEPLMPIKP